MHDKMFKGKKISILKIMMTTCIGNPLYAWTFSTFMQFLDKKLINVILLKNKWHKL